MRIVAAASVSFLVLASPAAALNTSPGISTALHVGGVAVKSSAATTAQDKAKSCQAGDGKSGKTLVGNKHRFATVACEQPPKSQVIPPLTKAAAAAIAVLG